MTDERRKKRKKKRPDDTASGGQDGVRSDANLTPGPTEGTSVDRDDKKRKRFFAFSGELDDLRPAPTSTQDEFEEGAVETQADEGPLIEEVPPSEPAPEQEAAPEPEAPSLPQEESETEAPPTETELGAFEALPDETLTEGKPLVSYEPEARTPPAKPPAPKPRAKPPETPSAPAPSAPADPATETRPHPPRRVRKPRASEEAPTETRDGALTGRESARRPPWEEEVRLGEETQGTQDLAGPTHTEFVSPDAIQPARSVDHDATTDSGAAPPGPSTKTELGGTFDVVPESEAAAADTPTYTHEAATPDGEAAPADVDAPTTTHSRLDAEGAAQPPRPDADPETVLRPGAAEDHEADTDSLEPAADTRTQPGIPTQTELGRPVAPIDHDAPTDSGEPAPAAAGAAAASADEAEAAPGFEFDPDADTDDHPDLPPGVAAEPEPEPEPSREPEPIAPFIAAPDEIEAPLPFADGPVFTEPEVAPLEAESPTHLPPAPRPTRVRRGRRAPRPGLARRLAASVRAKVRPRAWLKAALAPVREAYAGMRSRAPHAQKELKVNRTAQWWRRTLGEIAVLYAIVVPIELAVSGGRIGAFGLHPHPYWLIILPMAGARGVVAGLLAAGVGSLLYLLGAIQALGSGDASLLFTYKNMLEPMLFFGVAYFVGELHDELALRHRKLERQLDEVRERNQRLRQERDVLSDANRELEKRIVDESVQFGNLIVAATRIERSGRAQVFEIALDLVEEHCGAAASVLMLLEDGSLDYLCHRGWPDEEMGARLAAARTSGFVQRAIAQGTSVNGFSEGETPPESGPLVVAPLFYSGGVVKALLCLDEVPTERLNESTVTIFFGICEWVSAALARLVRDAEMPEPPKSVASVVQGDAYLGSEVDLGLRLRLELERCTRYGVPASFLTIQATEWTDVSPEGMATVDRYMLTHFSSGLRPSDELFRFGYPGCYLLVLAGTTVEGAEVVRSRLMRRVEYSPSSEVGAVEIHATGPDAEAPDLISLAERVAGRFRRFAALPLDARCPVHVPDRIEAGSITEFLRRLRMETSLATRNGFDLHVVGISASGGGSADYDLLARHVRAAGDRTLRATDGVYAIGPNHCAVVLPCTDAEEAATVAHRLVTAVRTRDPNAPYGDLETQVLSLGANHPDTSAFLRALARKERRA